MRNKFTTYPNPPMSRVSGRKEEKRREEWASSGSGSAALVPWKTLVQSEALQLDYTTVYSSRAPQCFLPVSTTTDWMRYTSGAALWIHPGHNLWTSNTESGALSLPSTRRGSADLPLPGDFRTSNHKNDTAFQGPHL